MQECSLQELSYILSNHLFNSFPYQEATLNLVITGPMRMISIPLESLNKAAYILNVVYNGVRQAIGPICVPRH